MKRRQDEFDDLLTRQLKTEPQKLSEESRQHILKAIARECESATDRGAQPRVRRPLGRLIAVIVIAAAAVFAQQLATRWSGKQQPVQERVGPTSPSERAAEVLPAQVEAPAPEAPEHPRLEFAAASVKPIAAGTMMPGAGLACHGTDGVQRVLLTFTSEGESAVKAPRGRCMGSGIFLSTLLEFAYGIPPRRIVNGPDWASRTGFITFDTYPGNTTRGGGIATLPSRRTNEGIAWLTAESYQIEATADNPSTATLAQLRQMLQAMLADRFKLKVHRQRGAVPGYSLVVAERGSKLKPVSGDYEESLVPYHGKSTLDKLARTLSSVLLDEPPIVDKTGLTGAYEYELRLFPLNPLALRGGGGNRGAVPPSLAERAENLSAALEEQLGLRLQPEKVVSVEVLVIDHVEPPSPN